MNAPDRIQELLAPGQMRVTGIDFIYVDPGQTTLDVYFLRPPGALTAPLTANPLNPEDIRIYAPSGGAPEMPVLSANWANVSGRDVLRIIVAEPGDFTLYNLFIDDLRIDPYFNDVSFSFKANCPSDLDCTPGPHECPPEEPVDFPVNYEARDFWSFRQALLDFASLRYPDWTDRLEADAGIMMTEVMSAMGDEMAYYQDRVSREAYLETASQRRSLVRHARLVDYEVREGTGARAWLDVTVKAGQSGDIPAGIDVWSVSDQGDKTDFEVGHGLAEVEHGKLYHVDALRNSFDPHIWDEDDLCLPVGATHLHIKGYHQANLPFDDFAGETDVTGGKWVLLRTMPLNPAQPARAHFVRLIDVVEERDPVFGEDITRLTWEPAQALPFELDLTVLTIRGNIIPVTAGKTCTAYFVTGADLTELTADEQTALLNAYNQAAPPVRAVERAGRDGSVTFLYTLPKSDISSLVWLGDEPQNAKPEISLHEVSFDGTCWINVRPWTARRSLIGINSAQAQDWHYTLDHGSWRRVAGYQRTAEEIVHRDYASNLGTTIQFGDGEFGLIPAGKTVFRVDYRLGNGRRGNVAAGALKFIADDRDPGPCDPALTNLDFLDNVTQLYPVENPLPAFGGMDPETPAEVRQKAPEAFRAITFRAVRPEDYAEAAERLPWVQRAGAEFRWTGSWLSAFVTPDPLGAVTLETGRRVALMDQLNRFRQAGREVIVSDPYYANLDLIINICVAPDAYLGEVKERVLEALLGKTGINPKPGYFSEDNFTFGTSLERSSLEAIIQAVSGVRAVEHIWFRRRGWFGWRRFYIMSYNPGPKTIIRVENDPLNPERGTLKLYLHGGA